jgi:CheY-like chemotaxis protein
MASVLVVDDDLDSCDLLVRMLNLLGYSAKCVGSGQAALDFVSDSVPLLIILDIMMPGMNGFEVLKALRAGPKTHEVPVIMHSAWKDEVTQRVAMRDGAQGYFIKTQLGLDELKDVVKRYVGIPDRRS